MPLASSRRTCRSWTAVMARAVALAALSLAAPLAVFAGDDGPHSATQLASLGNAADAPLSRLGLPVRQVIIDMDLRVLLARNGAPVATDAQAADDTILVALALAVPRSTEEEIARQYGLELIDRTELAELGLRIVQFRLPPDKAIGPVLAELRNDQRVRRAQRNSRYEPLPPATEPVPRTPRTNVGARPSEVNKTAAVDPAAKAAIPAARQRPASVRTDPAMRVGNVGDVLSGGL